MADKRISQLIERTDIANNDVLPIVASGATTTNKVTISTIQDWMQDNLDVGVTSVGITLGTTGTDVNVSGSPITTSGNITINIPDASATARGVVTTGTQTFAGYKIFNGTIGANVDIQLATQGTALNTFIKNINATGQTSIGSNGFGFNNANNIYFSGSSKGGGIIAFSNTGNQTYTLQDASGTLAFTSDIPSLTGYVTLNTAQTITAQKTFSTSGSSDTAIINHGSGSGIALNITKGGSGEGLRVTKTSGSGNAVTITGGTLSAEAGQFSGDLQTSTRISATSGSNAITITPNVGGTQNRIETTGSLPLSLVSAAAITMAAGGTTPQITLATTGAVTLTGALSAGQSTFTHADTPLRLNNAGGQFTQLDFQNNGTQKAAIWWNNTANSLNLFSGVTALTLASTGAATFSSSVGVGVTPSTWSNGYSALQVGSTSALFDVSSLTILSNNQYYNGGDLYLTTDSASRYVQYDGLHIWSNAPSGTAGSAITFTERMRITASGNVGIGTASPEIYGSGWGRVVGVSASSGGYSVIQLAGSSGNGGEIDFGNQTIRHAGIASLDGSNLGFYTNGSNSGSGLTERMRITSGGNVGIGNTGSNAKLEVTASSGEVFRADASGGAYRIVANQTQVLLNGNVGIGTLSPDQPLAFADGLGTKIQLNGNNTNGYQLGIASAIAGGDAMFKLTSGETGAGEFGFYNTTNLRMLITSGGNVGIGTASPTKRLDVRASVAGEVALIVNERNSTGDYGIVTSLGSNCNNTSAYHYIALTGGADRMYIYGNGNVVNTNNSYGAISDAKLKENITDASPKLDDLLKVKIRNYNLIGEETKQIGVIAQELEEVFPAMIDESEDFEEVEVPQLDEEGNEVLNEEGEVVTTKERISKGTFTKSVKYSVFVPMLIKAIQELKTEIDSLKTK